VTRHEHRLPGCRPEPLGSYLKALGVLRLVAEQLDGAATGHWASDGFLLESRVDDAELQSFFLHSYQPTPLVSPWNSSSGFGPEGAGELRVIEASDDPRLAPYRAAIAVARTLLVERVQVSKEDMLRECRSLLPAACVPWMDAAAVLTDERTVFPPLLGTGGNDGRLEFSRNFHQRVLDVLGLSKDKGKRTADWLADALFDTGDSVGLHGPSPGQFAPAAAGGRNSAAVGAANGVLNPWDWVLLLEGTLLLASGSARRLAANTQGRAAAPFTVNASPGGYSTATEGESTRGEFWAPLWSRPATVAELRALFAEARADWRGGHGATGLDLAKAAATLGVDRGIVAFSRHAFVERNGLATVAVPVGRMAARERVAVMPMGELDPWVERVRGASNRPAEVAGQLRQLEQASFALTSSGTGADLVQVLVCAARLEAAVGRSSSFRAGARIRPLAGLSARQWLCSVDFQEREVRLAACLASLRTSTGNGPGLLRLLLRPVASARAGRMDWTDGPAVVTGFGRRPVSTVLAEALVMCTRQAVDAEPGSEQRETRVSPGAGYPARLADVADLAAGRVDEARLGELLAAFLLLDVDARWAPSLPSVPPVPVPLPLALVGPFFVDHPASAGAPSGSWDDQLDRSLLRPEASWPRVLAAGRLDPVLQGALRRLRIAGLDPVPRWPSVALAPQPPEIARRLAAALHLQLSHHARRQLLAAVCPDRLLEPFSGSDDPGDARAEA